MVAITNFATLLEAGKQEVEPQEFLFVFLRAVLPENATPEEVSRFHAGQGGQLMPVMQVHKSLDELTDFSSLVKDAETFSEEWQLVLVACLAGIRGARPIQSEIDKNLDKMVDAVKAGRELSRYLGFTKEGKSVQW